MSTTGNEGLSWGALTQGLSQPQGGMPPWLQAILAGLAQQQPQPVPQIQTPVPGMEGGGALPSLGGPTPQPAQPTQPPLPQALGQGRREVTQAGGGGGFPGVLGAPPLPMLMAAAGLGGEEEKRNIGPFDASRVDEFLQQNQGGGALDFLGGGLGRTIGSLMPNMFAAGVARNMLGPTAETPTVPAEQLVPRPQETDVSELGPVGGPQGIATRQGAPTPTQPRTSGATEGLTGGAGGYERALGALEGDLFSEAFQPERPEHKPPVELDLDLYRALRAKAEEAEPESPTPESRWQKIVRTALQIGMGVAAGNNVWQGLAGGAMTGAAGWLKSTKEWDRAQTQYQTALGKHGVEMARLDLDIGKASQAQQQAQVDFFNTEEDIGYKLARTAYVDALDRATAKREVAGGKAKVLTEMGQSQAYAKATTAGIRSREKIAEGRMMLDRWRTMVAAQSGGDPLDRIIKLKDAIQKGGLGTASLQTELQRMFIGQDSRTATSALAEYLARSPGIMWDEEALRGADGQGTQGETGGAIGRVKQALADRGITVADSNYAQEYINEMAIEVERSLFTDKRNLEVVAKKDPFAAWVKETYY